ncbi:MAG: alkaline phosphatase family protein [Cyclobacteriaceae bacterium]|nr:alkaline phosphatase family protein [Cyclobacteriaceae bacterium]
MLRILCFGLAWFLCVHCTAQKKALLIIVDGIPADVIDRLQPPHLQQIAQKGGWHHAYTGGQTGTVTQSPTVSAVGYDHVITGTWSYKHNVWNNEIKSPNYNFPSVFRIFKQARPGGTTAIFSTWTDNRTKLAGEGASGFHFDLARDGYESDTARFSPKDPGRMQQIDDVVVDEAVRALRGVAPDLSWVYLEYPDDVGHRSGDGAEFDAAVLYADQQIGKIWSAVSLREKELHEEWLVVVTTDHGRAASDGKNHGGQSDRERATWIVTNVQPNAHFEGDLAAVDITPSVCRFLELDVPPSTRYEWDGCAFVGPAVVDNLRATLQGKEIQLTWRAFQQGTPLRVLLSTTNNTAAGGRDTYQELGSVDAGAGKFVLRKVKGAAIHKIVLEGDGFSASVQVR